MIVIDYDVVPALVIVGFIACLTYGLVWWFLLELEKKIDKKLERYDKKSVADVYFQQSRKARGMRL